MTKMPMWTVPRQDSTETITDGIRATVSPKCLTIRIFCLAIFKNYIFEFVKKHIDNLNCAGTCFEDLHNVAINSLLNVVTFF